MAHAGATLVTRAALPRQRPVTPSVARTCRRAGHVPRLLAVLLALLAAWALVLTTSKGVVQQAATLPATMPLRKDCRNSRDKLLVVVSDDNARLLSFVVPQDWRRASSVHQ